jgi:hypothetical protein
MKNYMDKKDERKLKPEFPLMKNEFSPNIMQIGPKPEIVEKLTLGRSETSKKFMEADIGRLRESINIDQIKPKFQMLNQDQVMKATKDLRTGKTDLSATLPKNVKIEDSRIPLHPTKALEAAMKKLNQRSIK